MKKIILIVFSISIFSCSNKELEYDFKGKFEYEIVNKTKFEKTYLNSKYGYVIGDLNISGIKIKNTENLENDSDYIISLNHPVVNVYIDSKSIRGEAQNHIKLKPLEVILNKNETSNKLYIYKLDKKNHYRVLLP